MDDTISRQAAIAYAISGKTREFDGDKWIRVSEVRESLKTMPSTEHQERNYLSTVYVAEVVRCCECIYHTADNECTNGHWNNWSNSDYNEPYPEAFETDYCSYGVKRNG